MEEHRLKPMSSSYDPKEFEKLYRDTIALKRKLASGIDERRYGMTKEDILSCFDIKLIHTYNRYCDEYSYEGIKSHCINALQNYKNKLLKTSYAKKRSTIVNSTYIEDSNIGEVEVAIFNQNQNSLPDNLLELMKKVNTYMKENLSSEAWYLFQAELCPPPMILGKMMSIDKNKINRIPNEWYAEFFELDIKTVKRLRREINSTIEEAKLDLKD